MYWVDWNDKLLANPTHRPTVVTADVAHAAIARIEVQVPSIVRVRSAERRTPNGVALVDACGISHTIWIVLSSLVGDDNSFLFSFLLAFQDKFPKTERTQKPL